MIWRIQWTIFFGILTIMLVGCNSSTESTDNASADVEQVTSQSDEHCEIRLNGNSIHDVIQIFEIPRFDLSNPIGTLYFPTGCTDNCPLMSVTVQGMMETAQSHCEADKQTCGVWYSVSWKQYADSSPVLGWVSERDEDIQWVGDCTNLPMIDPETDH